MGKAAIDLPDPLSPPEAAKPLTSTDDLLAQLAGEEIDRLLAEVDEQAAAAAPAAPVASPSRLASGPSQPIEFGGTPDPEPSAPPLVLPEDEAPAGGVAAVAAAAERDVNAELDAFFKTVKSEAAAEAQLAPSGHDALETSAAERAGLNAPAGEPAAGSAAAMKAAAPVGEVGGVEEGPLPVYLKPLEWINAPLEACPLALRDFIGKAAIITLVNAAAVMVYVLLFRRH